MITTAAIVLILIGLAANLVLQAWVQPRSFRADNKQQADLIIGRFDAQIDAVRSNSDNAARVFNDAERFFRDSEERFATIERRIDTHDIEWHTAHEQWKVVHSLAELVNRLDKRLTVVESVCASRHENSMRYEIEKRRDEEEG